MWMCLRYAFALSLLEMVGLLCTGSVVYWSVWVLAAFRVWWARMWGGGGVLWAVGFQEGVKDYNGKCGVVVIQMVVGYVLGMEVKPLDRV